MLNDMILKTIIDKIVKDTGALLIILFGSAAKGKLTPDSDIDVAFLTDKDISDYHRFIISAELAEKVNRNIDLVDLKKASTVFKSQIVGTGGVIYSSDDYTRKIFEMKTLKEYCLLNEERKIVLDTIKERSSVYGQ